jgi:hypothetical protein
LWNDFSTTPKDTTRCKRQNGSGKNAKASNWLVERDHDNDASPSLSKLLSCIEPRGTISGIARHLQIGKQTVRKFIAAKSFPEWSKAQQTRSAIDPYRDALKQLWDQGCRTPHQLWQSLQAEPGFSGGYMLV